MIDLYNSKRYQLPWDYHLVTDLMPFYHIADQLRRNDITREAKKRLEWLDYYHKHHNISLTCRYFGISRKTFYTWLKRYDSSDLSSLETRSRAPLKRRQPEITPEQELRVIKLRKHHLRYSKFKLAVIYKRLYKEPISSWKIQRVIQKHQLYFKPAKTARTQARRFKAIRKKRITELQKQPRAGFLLCADAIVIYWNSFKRYIFTCIDHYSKIGFARMYATKSSKSAQDFLWRLLYLYQHKIANLQTDNGSEFQGYFEKTLKALPQKIQRYFSRPHTPKDNPVNEKFNNTLKREFLDLGNFTPDVKLFNKALTEWLIEYNFNRPHQALGYQTPIEFHFQHHKVLPMCPSSACA